MTTHTPGPWEIEWSTITGRPLGIYAPDDAGVPGAVGSVVRRNGLGMPGSEAGKANARLIAAAPDLLTVLRDLTEQVGILLPFLDRRPAEVIRANEQARATIAKASAA